jgi:hypothetical protein
MFQKCNSLPSALADGMHYHENPALAEITVLAKALAHLIFIRWLKPTAMNSDNC